MSVEIFQQPDGSTLIKIILPYIEKRTLDAITAKADEAVDKLVEKFWRDNQDKIVANLDLKGLANLIAIHASKALKDRK